MLLCLGFGLMLDVTFGGLIAKGERCVRRAGQVGHHPACLRGPHLEDKPWVARILNYWMEVLEKYVAKEHAAAKARKSAAAAEE